jgi:hypothetical protein
LTGVIAAVSFLIEPNLWHDWVRILLDHRSAGGVSVVLRFVAA